MAGDIVPIELGLTEGNVFTLWAPRWRDGDDEWEAFLGLDEDIYGFPSVAELAAFVRSDSENDLEDHPAWEAMQAVSAEDLQPKQGRTFDLIAVHELAAEDPTPTVISELEDTLDIARTIGEVCELITVTKFFNGNPVLNAVTIGTRNFHGKEGRVLWEKVGRVIAKGWDEVVDAIDEVISSPSVDEKAVDEAQRELDEAAEKAAEARTHVREPDPIISVDDDELSDATAEQPSGASGTATASTTIISSASGVNESSPESDELDDSLWAQVGIDPIEIVTADHTLYSLRCYLDDNPVFLGSKNKIFVFESKDALAVFLKNDNGEHALGEVSTYEDVLDAAANDELHIEVIDDNVYRLSGISDDLLEGPRRTDSEQLELAVELLLDAADFTGDSSVAEALTPSTPLGWLVSYTINPDPKRLAPSGPFDNESEEWKALEHDLIRRFVVK